MAKGKRSNHNTIAHNKQQIVYLVQKHHEDSQLQLFQQHKDHDSINQYNSQ